MHVFGETVVFNKLSSALDQLGIKRAVTLEGELLEKSGAMTGGSLNYRSLGLSFGRVTDTDDCDQLKNRLLDVCETLVNCQKKEKELEFKYEGGILQFVEFLNEKKEKLKNKNGNDLFKKPIYIEGKKENIETECSLKWNAGYSEDLLAYTNNINQKDGGTHVLGFRSALTRVINKYANEHNLLKKNKLAISGDDIKEGLSCVLSIKIPDPKFSSQTKDKLVSSEIRIIERRSLMKNFLFGLTKIPQSQKLF